MTNDDGRKPEGAPERSPKAGAGAPSGVDGNGPKRFSVQRKLAIVARPPQSIHVLGGAQAIANVGLRRGTRLGRTNAFRSSGWLNHLSFQPADQSLHIVLK